jgi:MFS family permease
MNTINETFSFLVDYGETVIGYSKKQMTMIVTILGIGQFVGQLLFGFLANYSVIDELILYNIGAIICGIASCLIPFVAYSYWALKMAMLLFGLAISANYALTSIILANMCGLELLTSAYGLILLGQGLSSLFGPIIGGKTNSIDHASNPSCFYLGWIAEHYGYKLSLLIAGGFMGLSGCVTIVLYVLQWAREQNDTVKSKTVTEKTTTTVTSDS